CPTQQRAYTDLIEAERFNRPMPKVCDFMWVTCGGRGYSLGKGRAVGRKAVKRRGKICAGPYRTACSLCDKVERCRGRVCSCPVPSPDTCPENFLNIWIPSQSFSLCLLTTWKHTAIVSLSCSCGWSSCSAWRPASSQLSTLMWHSLIGVFYFLRSSPSWSARACTCVCRARRGRLQ